MKRCGLGNELESKNGEIPVKKLKSYKKTLTGPLLSGQKTKMDPFETARQLLSLEEKWLEPFEVTDPINDGIRLKGFLSIKPDHRYGALAITHVEDACVPQVIYATPKIAYPFGKDSAFHFPKIQTIDIYEKIDGTNVLAYQYQDAQGTRRVTYKLRLHPVLRNSRWGPFLDMWQELIGRYPSIPRMAVASGMSISFEMYGARNPHLVIYDEPLECAVLFGINQMGTVTPVGKLDHLHLPQPRLWGTLDARSNPVEEYGQIRKKMEANLTHLEDGKLKGTEGTVWYVTDVAGRVWMFKCKPESVEAIHWAGGINKEAVLATCWNVLETADELTFETLLPLLKEEYQERDIKAFKVHIEDCIGSVNQELTFRNRVFELYEKVGLSVHENKTECLRALSSHFKKTEMRKVYAALMQLKK